MTAFAAERRLEELTTEVARKSLNGTLTAKFMGEAEAEGNLLLEGGPNDEHIEAVRGKYNLQEETGKFEDAIGSVSCSRATRRTRRGCRSAPTSGSLGSGPNRAHRAGFGVQTWNSFRRAARGEPEDQPASSGPAGSGMAKTWANSRNVATGISTAATRLRKSRRRSIP